jgi:phage tail sheath protein FI
MAIAPTYPGVYIQEIPSTVHTIVGVATSITAFVGYTARGIDNRAEQIFSPTDFTRLFGGLASDSELSYAVQQFFANGGTQAWVVRTPRAGAKAAAVQFDQVDKLTFTALSSGAWANGQLLLDVDYNGVDQTADATAFNLTVTNLADGTIESFPNLSLQNSKNNFIVNVLNDIDNGSQLVNVGPVSGSITTPPAITGIVGQALTLSNVNQVLAGGPPPATATANWGVSLTVSSPAAFGPFPLDIKIFAQGQPLPQTVAGLASQLQTAINAALAVKLPGASVQCSVSGTGSNQSIRVNALLPQYPDAVIVFGAPAANTLSDASTALGLASPTSNVAHYALGTGNVWGQQAASTKGTDGTGLPGTDQLIGDPSLSPPTGIYALTNVDIFNLLCIPEATRAMAGDPSSPDTTVDTNSVYSAAIAFCVSKRAFLLLDCPPNINTISAAVDWKTSGLTVVDPSGHGAAFFPRLRLPDPLNNYNLRTFAPCGVVAGLYAQTDSTRGVWKAPAGTAATLAGVQSLVYKMSDAENGVLNPLGLNCFRTFPVYGSVLWGARTLVGADAETSQWKYVPVRRVALFLEESLYRGTQWVVFEPNDEPLWSAIRLNVGSFMQDLFIQGYFQGQTPAQAYFVKCDSETTTQTDINNGIVNIVVGFAPLKPAEFVVIQIQQMSGQTAS